MWQRVGGGSERGALLFGSGYSTMAGIKKENEIDLLLVSNGL